MTFAPSCPGYPLGRDRKVASVREAIAYASDYVWRNYGTSLAIDETQILHEQGREFVRLHGSDGAGRPWTLCYELVASSPLGFPSFIERAQRVSLLGEPDPHQGRELLAPYQAFGQPPAPLPYDLKAAGVVSEIKRALVALAQMEADRSRSPNDPATERLWRDIDLSPSFADAWHPAAAQEYALAVSRYRTSAVPPPYLQFPAGSTSGPQPTAAGLELLAGAVNTRLGGTPRMTIYEAWRGVGPGGVAGAPDLGVYSVAWALAGGTKRSVKPTQNVFGSGAQVVKLPSPMVLDSYPLLRGQIHDARATQVRSWQAAAKADNEKERDFWATAMENHRRARDQLVDKAIALDTTQWKALPAEHRLAASSCQEAGGEWVTLPDGSGRCQAVARASAGPGFPVWAVGVAGAVAAAGYWWYTRRAA